MPPETILDYDYGTYKSYFSKNFVLQSLLYSRDTVYSWQEGHAEVEFLDVVDGKIIPIEVKSGWITRSQSIAKFQQKYDSPYCVVMSTQPMLISLEDKLHQIPLYLAEDF